MCLFDLGTAVTKNLLRQDFKVTTILDINKDKCSNYPCKVVETPKQVAEEVDITITGTISIKSLMTHFQFMGIERVEISF